MIVLTRRKIVGAALAASASSILPARSQPTTDTPRFGFDDVVRRARDLAIAPFEDKPASPPAPFDKLDFDAWRDIRSKKDQILLNNGGEFRLEPFHRGFLFQRAVTINTIRDGIAAPIPYAPSLFDYGRLKVDHPPPIDMGFAGFRLLYPLNDPHIRDEVISFLGASYFRFLGRDQSYGLSARGLAVETGTNAESFPFFREFWIEAPQAGENRITLYALLDSEAATGAYRLELSAAQESALDIQVTLFPRRNGVKFGLAPLTSMFLNGENDRRVLDGYRNELHDSDGLLVHTGGGEWLWRPLSNPVFVRTSSFLDENTRGFGLLQRDRAFQSYQDLDLKYEKRPSYFVEPTGDWGHGRVELIELPTTDETNDNIVASWTPAAAPEAGKAFVYAYRLSAGLDMPRLEPNGRAVNTFQAPARSLGSSEPENPDSCRFLVDFAGGDLAYYVADPGKIEAVVSTTRGTVTRTNVQANPSINGLRAMIDIVLNPGETADLRLFLRAGGRTLTETWTCPWTAPTVK